MPPGPSLFCFFGDQNIKETHLPTLKTVSQYIEDTEDAIGVWKKEGGGKPHEGHPSLPKRGLDPPRTVRFPPRSGVSALFFLYKNPRQSRPEALLEESKNFRESALFGTFPPPIRFAPPHITAQKTTPTPNKNGSYGIKVGVRMA